MRSATIALHTVAAGAVIELFGHIARRKTEYDDYT